MRPALALAFLALTTTALAQNTAQGPTITLTPSYGSTAFVPGASVWATGRDFRRGFTDVDSMVFRYSVTVQPGNIECRVVQVDRARLWFILPFNLPMPMASVTIRGPFFTEVIPITIIVASPTIQARGWAASFRNNAGGPWDGVITFPPMIGIVNVTMFGAGFGQVRDWVVHLEGNGVTVEVLAAASPLGQPFGFETLYFQLPFLPTGSYRVTTYALSDAALASNAISVEVR